jgi:hypothetical protein
MQQRTVRFKLNNVNDVNLENTSSCDEKEAIYNVKC